MKRLASFASSILLALPLLAQARDAFTVDDVSLQAGPDEEYPSIAQLPAGSEVSLQGCIEGWTWCDVIAGDDRGWVPASYLEEEYNNQRVLVVDYGPRIGIPVVSFSLGAYWDRHYHNRPWYHERASWESRRIQPRAMPRPTQASRGGAELRAHADVRTGEQRAGEQRTGEQQANAIDTHRRDERSAATRDRYDAARSQQSSATRQSSDAQMSARAAQNTATTNAATTQEHAQNQTTPAQSDAHATAHAAQHDSALGATRQMPPQVQTARNNTPPSSAAQPAQQHAQPHARDENRHDQGEHKGEAKDKDHDRDSDHDHQ